MNSTDRTAGAVAVVSGGLDSVTLAYLLKARGHPLHLLSFDYGQKHRKELQHAKRAAEALGASWHLVDLTAAGIQDLLGHSALTDPSVPVPQGHYQWDTMQITVVPNRNAIMLTIAYAAALSLGAGVVATAVHAGDHAIYPDCRPEFVDSFQQMERLACDGLGDVALETPFITKSKADIVRVGADLGVPFEQTWSCYEGGRIHCGACGTCFERREAFQLAAVPDPTDYVSTPSFETTK